MCSSDLSLAARAETRGLPLPDGTWLMPVRVPRRKLVMDRALPVLRDDYYSHMQWNATSGHVSKVKAKELGMAELLEGFTE